MEKGEEDAFSGKSMNDEERTREQLIEELIVLRAQLDLLTGSKAVRKTQHQESLLDTMTGRMEDMVYYKDKDFRYVFSSKPHCRRILKCSQEECLGHTDEEITRFCRHGDDTGPAEIYGVRDLEAQAAGEPSRFEVAATLVTARRAADEQVR